MPLNETVEIAIRILICFALGSIPFAVLAMRGTGVNILKSGSGNPGFNNVLRFNKGRAVLTLLGDFGKGSLAIWLFHQPGDASPIGWLYGFAVVLGHCYSPFLKFNGGKGIATSGGVMLMLYPMWAACALAFYTVMRITGSRRKWVEAGTIASLGTWVVFTFLMFFVLGPKHAAGAALMTAFVAWRHKKNFQILTGAVQPQR